MSPRSRFRGNMSLFKLSELKLPARLGPSGSYWGQRSNSSQSVVRSWNLLWPSYEPPRHASQAIALSFQEPQNHPPGTALSNNSGTLLCSARLEAAHTRVRKRATVSHCSLEETVARLRALVCAASKRAEHKRVPE